MLLSARGSKMVTNEIRTHARTNQRRILELWLRRLEFPSRVFPNQGF